MPRRKTHHPVPHTPGRHLPLEVRLEWELGQPLPLPLFAPDVTGIGGMPQLIDPAVWVQAITAETNQHGVRYVFERMMAAGVALGLSVSKPEPMPDEIYPVIEREMQQETVMGWWEDWLAQLRSRLGTTPRPEPPPQGSESALQYLERNRDLIAAYAWLGYTQAGRGAVIIFQRLPGTEDQPVSPAGNAVRAIGYASLEAGRELEKQWPGNTEQFITTYNPRTGFVVIVESPDGNATALSVRTIPPPPEAYRLYKDAISALPTSGEPGTGEHKV